MLNRQEQRRILVSAVPKDDWTLFVEFEKGESKIFDAKPLLECEAFKELRDLKEFLKIRNGGYFIEWENEADLSADTLYLQSEPIKSSERIAVGK